jgi:C-terminal processing protease CtpA/Prc
MKQVLNKGGMLAVLALASLACMVSIPIRSTPAATTEVSATPTASTATETRFPAAKILHDEGGPVTVTGELSYTYPFFTAGVTQPIVILEDQGGFVERDHSFVIPVESQVLGKITSDFYTSPFSYSVDLPEAPNGTQHDVDHDDRSDQGVQIYAVAYWTNTYGDPYLEVRDQGGGAWSTAYASTRISDDRDFYHEVYGGKYLVFSPQPGLGFPSGFGADRKLFTDDDPVVGLPEGWTLVDLDTDPFTFDRSSSPTVDLLEPESLALDDFSGMSYAQAFDAMLAKFRTEYAFTDYKGIDWDQREATFRPRFIEADAMSDGEAYALALRDFLWAIPDAHVGMDTNLLDPIFAEETAGGVGIAIRQLDDGRVLVSFVTPGGPADRVGVKVGDEVLELNGQPIEAAVEANVPWASPFSNLEAKRLQQLRYALRFPVGTDVSLRIRRPRGAARTLLLKTVNEVDSFRASSLYAGITGTELPVDFKILDNGVGYVRVYSFFDNELLTIQLWERMIQTLNNYGLPALIIDLRNNGGGDGWLADQMAAYFFDQPLELGNTGHYDDSIGDFYFDPGDTVHFIPPREDLRYFGRLVTIVGPACASACEFFAYDLTLASRSDIIGYYSTAGAGGSVEDFLMPENISVRMTTGRAVDADGNIHIEGIGVPPTIRIPFDQAAFDAEFVSGSDVLLDSAEADLQ